MKFINWLKAKKKRSKELRQQKLERSFAPQEGKTQQLQPDDTDTTLSETRYTPEYQEFLKKQENAGASAQNSCEES